ncbi:signal peptidase II [Lujinxingia vulgaris]|uniref:Lipoprotein signal peptidase n=1 Tax=Lujinxingia vulgaris TaxID=2600176 RepID=A0A5C6WWJ1_9DELT|nr:signal peptidase II [Lujinxingia vulgaris]TXD33747.1 signal peptidase II [Lujinxingia vulgaris]
MKKLRLSNAALLALIIITSVGCDQATKIVAREQLEGAGRLSYLGDTFRLVLIENHGAFLGMGSEMPAALRTAIFVGVVSIALIAFLVWIMRTPSLSKFSVVAAGLVIGGGIGNVIDRVLFDGGVTDFLNLGIGTLRTGIFNVADVWIMVGAAMMLISRDTWAPDDARSPDEDGSPAAEDSGEDPRTELQT